MSSRRAPTRRGHERRVAVLARVAGRARRLACTHLQHSGGGGREQLAAAIETLFRRPAPRLSPATSISPTDVEPLLAAWGFTAAPSGPTFPAGAPSTPHRLDRRWTADLHRPVVGARRRDPVVVAEITARSAPIWPWSRGPNRPIVSACRTRLAPCTTPTRTSWSRPTGSHPYLDADDAQRFPFVGASATRPGRQAIAKERGPSRRHRVPRRGRVADHAAQELPRDRLVPERRPAAGARSARLREPARVRHVHEPARPALRPRRRPRARGHSSRAAQHRAMLDWCSVDPRLLPVTRRSRRRHGRGGALAREAIDAGTRGDLDRPVLPARSLAESRRPRAAVGDVRGSGRAGRAARRGRGRAT